MAERRTGISEEAVGIRRFCSDHAGFNAITKQRFSDFIVREVAPSGKVIRLQTLATAPESCGRWEEATVGAAERAELAAAIGDADADAAIALQARVQAARLAREAAKQLARAAKKARGPGPAAGLGPTATATATTVEPATEAAATEAVAAAEAGSVAAKHVVEAAEDVAEAAEDVAEAAEAAEAALRECDELLLPRDDDKAHRTLVHGLVKRLLPALESETADAAGGKRVRLAPRAGAAPKRAAQAGAKRQRRDTRAEWPAEAGDNRFLGFTLYKENRDTNDALGQLARALHLSPNTFTFAGTKDRRAVTSQRVTAFKLPKHSLCALMSRAPFGDSIRVGDLRYEAAPLRLGMLAGNRFCVTLRAVDADADAVDAAVRSLQDKGFVNYFGLQRFGANADAPTHAIGAALLRSDWEDALALLLAPRSTDRPEEAQAKALFKGTRDAAAALQLMPRRANVERSLLEGLRDHGANDVLSAMGRLPKSLRSMYVHAYQSFVWNCAASARLELDAQRAVEGDLVLPARATGGDAEAFVGDAEGAAEGAADADAVAADAGPAAWVEPHVVSAAEAVAGAYGLCDVVLPLPGTRTRLPVHAVAEVYAQLLAQDGLAPDCFAHRVKELAMGGAYRHVVQRPHALEWQLMRYCDGTLPLAQTDLAALRGQPAPRSEPNAPHLALLIQFTLPPSTYATMLLRESRAPPS